MRRIAVVVTIVCLASIAAVPAYAQTPRPGRPAATAAAAFAFPHVQSHILQNGLRVIVVEDHTLPLVAVRAVFDADSTADPSGREGLYAVTIGAMREGTTSRSGDELAEASAEIGSVVSPVGFTTLAPSFGRALDLLGDMLMHPRFDDAAVERRKTLQSTSAQRAAQAPVAIPRRLFYSALYWPDDPFVRSLSATPATVAPITRADVVQFYRQHIVPEGTAVVIVGDVSDGGALAAATRVFGAWSGARTVPVAPSANAPQRRPTTIYLHDAPGTQAYLYVGAPGPSRASNEAAAADLLAAVANARVQQTLRDRRSFMYSGTTGIVWRRAPATSAFVGSTVVSAAKVDSALSEWLSLLRGLSTPGAIAPEELDAARRSRVGSLPARIDGPDSLAARLVEIARDGLPLDYFDRYAARAAAVTAADVVAAASAYADVNHLIVVISGDRGVIEPALRAARMGPVVIVDTAGRPVEP